MELPTTTINTVSEIVQRYNSFSISLASTFTSTETSLSLLSAYAYYGIW